MSARAPSKEQAVQEDLLRLDAYRGQLNAILQQHQYLQGSRLDHLRARSSLEGFEKTGTDADLLIPLGAEAFVRGSPVAPDRILLGIGSGLVVDMARPQAVERLADRIGKIDEATRGLEDQIHQLEERIADLSERLEAAAQSGSGDAGGPGDVGGD